MKHKDIICLSTHYWHDFWFRKQHFMSRFAEIGHRVLYVQPSYSMFRHTIKPGVSKNPFFQSLVTKISDNIYLFYPPRFLPKPNYPPSSYLSHRWFGVLIRHAATQLNMKDIILWIYSPEYAAALHDIPHSKLVFDLADDLSAYNKESCQYRSVCINRLAAEADLMVVTSPTLLNKYNNKTKQCILIPNGFDEKLFTEASKKVPSDLRSIPKPIVGFVGVLFEFIDYKLIHNIATKLKNISFVFVGPIEKSGREGVDRLNKLSNTYFLGSKIRQEIPSYISNFDICINPFKLNDVAHAVSPLKVYEYIACGKQVISTRMEGLIKESVSKWITFADEGQFSESLLSKLNQPSPIAKHDLTPFFSSYSWEGRFKLLKHSLENLMIS